MVLCNSRMLKGLHLSLQLAGKGLQPQAFRSSGSGVRWARVAEQPLGMVKSELTSRLAFTSRSCLLPPPASHLWGSLPGNVCPLNHTAILSHYHFLSCVFPEEEISYKPCPHPPPQSTYKHEAAGRIAVFAQAMEPVSQGGSPVTNMAAVASATWSLRSPHSWRDVSWLLLF